MERGHADASADADDGRVVLPDMRRLSERAEEMGQPLALPKLAQSLGRSADGLEDNGDRPLLRVRIGYGEGDAFPVAVVRHEDDELSRLSSPGDRRGVELHEEHVLRQLFLPYDLCHGNSPCILLQRID